MYIPNSLLIPNYNMDCLKSSEIPKILGMGSIESQAGHSAEKPQTHSVAKRLAAMHVNELLTISKTFLIIGTKIIGTQIGQKPIVGSCLRII